MEKLQRKSTQKINYNKDFKSTKLYADEGIYKEAQSVTLV